MGLISRVKSHKAKLKKYTNYDTSRRIQKPGTPKGHRSMTSHFNVINKCGQKVSNQSDVDDYKQTDSFKNP